MIGRSLVALTLLSAAGLLVACGDSGTNTAGGDQGGSDEGGSAPQGGNNTGAGNTGGDGPMGGNAPDDCGNGAVDAGEDCDGTNLDGSDCESEGFVGGTLACSASCTFDTADCTQAECGDGSINGTEDCDGTLLGGATCMTEGFDNGTLACGKNCSFDTSGCSDISCGDGAINGAEECDGALLGTNTCQTELFDGGTLACMNCQLDTSGCANEDCTDAVDNEADTLVDCLDTDCAPECADACNTIPVITDPGTVSGDTTGHADVFDASCPADFGGTGGGEVIYQVTATVTGVLEVTMSSAFDIGVSAWTGCGTGEIICDDSNGGGTDEFIALAVTAGDTVFIGVEGYQPTIFGAYTLDVASRAIVCGDTLVDPGEECDDGNLTSGDGCESNCQLTCGNGVINPPEVCDDGNSVAGDGCNANCSAFECANLTCPGDANACTLECTPQAGCVASFTPTQPHAKCTTGTAMINAPGCTTGAQGVISAICAADPFCCNNSWDATCVNEVYTIGDNKTCPNSQGTCSHSLCSTGVALTANCDSTFGDCVDQICAVDPFCCGSFGGNWDGACVNEVASVCALNCF